MAEDKLIHLSVAGGIEKTQPARTRRQRKNPTKSSASQPSPKRSDAEQEAPRSSADRRESPPPPPWHQFLRSADNRAISTRFAQEATSTLASLGSPLVDYCILVLLDSDSYISEFELDRIFAALLSSNTAQDKDVLLFLLSPGGRIEPAYQMSKLCKSFARNRFIVAVPRQAKSAATLLAIGADEIHMGPLGHLGPIDPQLDGLPALGVSQALKSLAAVAEQYPGSSEMLSKYLKLALTVEQIGYCERISESAAQYAERLLQTKGHLPKPAKEIARDLVQEYKHHGFVIDLDEARQHLGADWIKTGTPEMLAAEQLYNLFDQVNLFLDIYQQKRLLVAGGLTADDVLVFNRPRRPQSA